MFKSVNEAREAEVHFELYRHLMNVIGVLKEPFDGVQYLRVKPEVPVNRRFADLVIEAEINGSLINILVIEVKRRVRSGLTTFDSSAEEQVSGYAEQLASPYYALTDGQRLRLFKTPDELIGNYEFSLDKDYITRFLEALSALYLGEAKGLPFNTIKDPSKEIEKAAEGFTKKLLDLFEKLSSEEKVKVRQRGYVKHVGIGKYAGLLMLGVYKDPGENYIDINLKALEKALGDNYHELMNRLSEIPGFRWVRNEESTDKHFVWKKIKNIVIEASDIESTCKNLEKWILKLEEKLRD